MKPAARASIAAIQPPANLAHALELMMMGATPAAVPRNESPTTLAFMSAWSQQQPVESADEPAAPEPASIADEMDAMLAAYHTPKVFRYPDGRVMYVERSHADRENSRRVGFLVLKGHTLAEARRLAPQTTWWSESWPDGPVAPDRLVAGMIRTFHWRVARHGLRAAANTMAAIARDRARSVSAAAAADTSRTPLNARRHAERVQVLRDSHEHRRSDRAYRLIAAGVHPDRDFDVLNPEAIYCNGIYSPRL